MPQLYWDNIVKDNIIYRKQANNTLIITGIQDVVCKDTMEHIIIPECVENMPVVAIADKAFYRYNNLRSIKLPATLTHVGKNAFSNCQRLEDVHFKSNMVTLERAAFCGCGKLCVVSGWMFEVIDCSTFEGCSRLELIDAYFVGDIKLNTFLNCKRLIKLYFCDGITIYKNAFIGCMSLTELHFDGFVTIEPEAMSFIAKRTIFCKEDCSLASLIYSGTNVILHI